jgi:LDH2 family malate/lactate/ureidoglycolate dehydrogenase
VEKIYYPGEIEMEKMAKCRETGYVEILDETMSSVERIEKELGLR